MFCGWIAKVCSTTACKCSTDDIQQRHEQKEVKTELQDFDGFSKRSRGVYFNIPFKSLEKHTYFASEVSIGIYSILTVVKLNSVLNEVVVNKILCYDII